MFLFTFLNKRKKILVGKFFWGEKLLKNNKVMEN